MRKIINIISGFIYGLAPISVAIIIGIAVYAALPNVAGIIIIFLLGILSFWLGISIFKRIQIIGPLEFMTAVHATPELDNLEPTKGSVTKRRKPEEIGKLLSKRKHLCKGGSFRIFGDWFGQPYKNFHEIKSADFDIQLKRLTLNFKQGEKLEIDNPVHIFESPTFLKIVKADRIKLTWFYDGKTRVKAKYYIEYKRENKKIVTDTDVDWYKPVFDVSLGDPALIIYG